MDDWSSFMIRNINADPRMAKSQVGVQIVKRIWSQRNDLLLRLNNAMMKIKQMYDPRVRPADGFSPATKTEGYSKPEGLIC
ncbi:hypothetical protein BDR07DRAFT_1493267 [Suillus spraguei]|nr:hypothetical protein BDR07DRAFT_1493267 [Suillus spraguei]